MLDLGCFHWDIVQQQDYKEILLRLQMSQKDTALAFILAFCYRTICYTFVVLIIVKTRRICRYMYIFVF